MLMVLFLLFDKLKDFKSYKMLLVILGIYQQFFNHILFLPYLDFSFRFFVKEDYNVGSMVLLLMLIGYCLIYSFLICNTRIITEFLPDDIYDNRLSSSREIKIMGMLLLILIKYLMLILEIAPFINFGALITGLVLCHLYFKKFDYSEKNISKIYGQLNALFIIWLIITFIKTNIYQELEWTFCLVVFSILTIMVFNKIYENIIDKNSNHQN